MRPITSITVRATAIVACLSLTIPGGLALAANDAGPAARPAARRAPLPVIKVAMTGKIITVSGALHSGAVRVVSTVTGEPAGAPTFFRLHRGVTVAQLLKVLAHGDPNQVALIASVVFSPYAHRGTSWAQVNLAPGRYAALDGGPNTRPLPLTTFTIAKASSPAKLPKPQARISAIEFGFRGPDTLHNGELVRFRNHGFVMHMMEAGRGANLAGARKIAKLLRAGKDGQAFRLSTGETAFFTALTHGAHQQQRIHIRPGYWVLACFMDTQDGREHTQLGMERVIHITK